MLVSQRFSTITKIFGGYGERFELSSWESKNRRRMLLANIYDALPWFFKKPLIGSGSGGRGLLLPLSWLINTGFRRSSRPLLFRNTGAHCLFYFINSKNFLLVK